MVSFSCSRRRENCKGLNDPIFIFTFFVMVWCIYLPKLLFGAWGHHWKYVLLWSFNWISNYNCVQKYLENFLIFKFLGFFWNNSPPPPKFSVEFVVLIASVRSCKGTVVKTVNIELGGRGDTVFPKYFCKRTVSCYAWDYVVHSAWGPGFHCQISIVYLSVSTMTDVWYRLDSFKKFLKTFVQHFLIVLKSSLGMGGL